ncbi:MAG: glycosyltransferase family 1 protein, partial [Pseudomonadota bacterium]
MARELRVALFSGNYNYHKDGANKALNRLVGFLESKGVNVLVFSPTSSTPAFEHTGTLVSVPSVPVPGRGEYRLGLPLSRRTRADLAAFEPDIVHLSAPDWLGHSALSWAEANGRPAVASFHTRFDTYLEHYGLGWLGSACRARMAGFYRRCDKVLVPSPSMATILAEQKIVRDNVGTWSRGIERDRFSPSFYSRDWRREQGIADDDVLVTFVGRLVKEKNLGVFADMIDRLAVSSPKVRAMLVGDGPEFNAMGRRLPNAVMMGHLLGDDLAQAYASSDIFVNPSETETFGNVTLEAMASGTVPVCVDATGSADLIDHGHNGLLVNGPDPDALAAAVEGLANEPEWRGQLAAQALEA